MKSLSKHAEKMRYHVGVVVTDLMAFTGLTSLEMARFYTINEAGREFFSELNQTPIPPPNYDSPLVQVLQYSGDLWDGYVLSLGIYYLLSAVSLGKIPEHYRVSAAFFTSSLVVIGTETGLLYHGGSPDYYDIPAGIMGAAAFIGVHFLARRLASRARQDPNTSSTDQEDNIEQRVLDGEY